MLTRAKIPKRYTSLKQTPSLTDIGLSDNRGSCDRKAYVLRKPHVCRNCNKHFALSEYLKNHIRTQYACGRFFARARNLKMRERVLTSEGTYACPTCHRCFNRFRLWRRHVEIHRCGESHTCHIYEGCRPKLRKSRDEIQRHISRSRHSCNRCRKNSVDLLKLARPFRCVACNKSYCSALELERHKVVHIGEKQHVCTKCDERFTTFSALMLHLSYFHAVHAQNVCEMCGIRFFHAEHLQMHMSIHTYQKSHSCGQCGKTFSTLKLLRRHEKFHATAQRESG